MNQCINSFMVAGIHHYMEMEEILEIKKKEILKAWIDSKDLPRKKKKQRRKELKVDWAIYNWKPWD